LKKTFFDILVYTIFLLKIFFPLNGKKYLCLINRNDTDMSATTVETKRKEIFRMLLNINDESVLAAIEEILRESNNPVSDAPCLYSPKALREAILQSRENVKNGRLVTMEHMRAKHPRP
jgi:hypothetical protein